MDCIEMTLCFVGLFHRLVALSVTFFHTYCHHQLSWQNFREVSLNGAQVV